jgi:hypothetical protein
MVTDFQVEHLASTLVDWDPTRRISLYQTGTLITEQTETHLVRVDEKIPSRFPERASREGVNHRMAGWIDMYATLVRSQDPAGSVSGEENARE